MKKYVFPLTLLFLCVTASAQRFQSSSDILHELKKLQNPTRVLYLAAHPDDENTRMISWLVNGQGCNTAYLSLTRGDGGQNLIGPELGVKLGILRTQELMQARAIDGGQQFFSRAVDFGYSKNADETFTKWGKEEVLSDVVWVIRKFRPDVIITRFPPDSRAGHGHHTASAMLGIEAFKLAADEDAYKEHLDYVDTWQPKRIYWNASVWWNRKLDSIAQVDDNYVVVEVGGYNNLMGSSYNELASLSRTQHKSQGFGVSVARGGQKEYLKHLAGSKAQESLFEGVPQSWGRYNFKEADQILAEIINRFNPNEPSKSLPKLLELKSKSIKINDIPERIYFRNKIDEVIQSILGIHVEVRAQSEYITLESMMQLDVEVLNRSNETSTLDRIEWKGESKKVGAELISNETFRSNIEYSFNNNSQPYWLKQSHSNLFKVADQELIGLGESLVEPELQFIISVQGKEFSVPAPITYKYSDRVEGEIINPVVVTPKVTGKIAEDNLVFFDDRPQKVNLQLKFYEEGDYRLNLKATNWQLEPSSIEVTGANKDETKDYSISISPTSNSSLNALQLSVEGVGPLFNLYEMDYNHIDKRIIYEPVEPELVKLNLNKLGAKVAYIQGAGDKVAEAIARMGYQVDILSEESIKTTDLTQYQAVIAGIRAYNTQKWLPNVKDILMDYVKNGGNYIVQYNTRSRDLLSLDIGPYPFTISRERVTEEDSKVDFLLKTHPVLNVPNQITSSDFQNWVQERGLYFASDWDENYQAPIGWHDKGEPSRNGGLLIGNHGKGAFIYTGISFFRELPAGVPGAYRLLANIISYQNLKADETKP